VVSRSGRSIVAPIFEYFRADGYITRFGVTYVDYKTQERYPKESAKFLVKVSSAMLKKAE
jgi:beta-glucosidase/6-phospho-beta-glucosidase/beta-galactosidase